jgi:26S proteasome regulatory subunit N3
MAKDKEGDVEMADAQASGKKDEDAKMAEPPASPEEKLAETIKADLKLIQTALAEQEYKNLMKLNRRIIEVRKVMDGAVLAHFLTTSDSSAYKEALMPLLPEPWTPEKDGPPEDDASTSSAGLRRLKTTGDDKEVVIMLVYEATVWVGLLTLIHLLDAKKLDAAKAASDFLIAQTRSDHRPSLRYFAAQIWFYASRVHELAGNLAVIRPQLLQAYRTACLHHDDTGQATLLNLLLRNYLHYNLYDQAVQLVAKTTFPDARVNSQFARYLYYQGRMKAVQLEYSEAHQYLTQALRKGPKAESAVGLGFRAKTTMLSIVVELLMGEIPDRSVFASPELRAMLRPYFAITQAVRLGDLIKFQEALTAHEKTFQAQQTLSLIKRLRHNVIKTGLRAINVSYSAIHLDDIANKVGLVEADSVQGIVAKAISDGVIDATLNSEKKYLKSNPMADVYSTYEPQKALHKRIDFCMQLHAEAVKAMRYPEVKPEGGEDDEERRERERALVAAVGDGSFDDDDDFM